MKSIVTLVIISACFVLAKGDPDAASPKQVVCYRYGLLYDRKNSHNDNCTHVILRYGLVDRKTGHVEPYTSYNISMYKAAFPYLKFILGIDPFDKMQNKLPQVLNSESGRRRIIRSTVDLVKKEGYDGIDLAFQHKYVHQTAIVASGIRKEIGRKGITLSGIFLKNVSKDDFHRTKLSDIAKDLDFMTIECYEITKTEPYTELAAPLYSRDRSSVSRSIKWFLKMGAPRNKVLMGIQTYAVTHTLDDPDSNGVESPSKEKGWLVYPGHSAGFLHLFQITGPGWIFDRDELSQAPYASNYFQWASFEDEVSVLAKVHFIKDNGLAGAALTTSQWNDVYDKELPFAKFVSEILTDREVSSQSD